MRKLLIAGVLLATVTVVACGDDATAPLPKLLLVTNGGFETGDLTGWTDSIVRSDTSVPGGIYITGDTIGPASGHRIPLPAYGAYAALNDQDGPTMHILYQDIMIPAKYSAAFTATIYLNNENITFVNAPNDGLSILGEANQQFRIDVMDPSAPVDDVGAGVLQNLYQTVPADSLTPTKTVTVTADLSGFAGETIRLRFAEAGNQFYFQAQIDSVQVTGT